MFFTVNLRIVPTQAQEKPVTRNLGSSEQLLSNNTNSLSNDRGISLTQDSRVKRRSGFSRGELDEVTNNINLQIQKNRDQSWKSEKEWFDEK